MLDNTSETTLIMKLLQETTSMSIVSNFLKEKGLRHSASNWETLYSKRIAPALANNEINNTDLAVLLQKAEEYGRKHIFLYKCSDIAAKELLDEKRLEEVLNLNGLTSLLTNPKILDQPEIPTLADIRWTKNRNGLIENLLIKIIEARTSMEFVGESTAGTFVNKQYRQVKERAVNIVKIGINGNLEIRITSQKNSSHYRSNLDQVWQLVENIIPHKKFSEISLSKAKERLWQDKSKLHDIIRFSDSTLRNGVGTVLRVATGSLESDLFDDAGATNSLATFLNHEAYCETFNIWFKAGDKLPSKEIHVLLSGKLNEFAIPAHCNQEDHEYVLDQLRRLNI